MFRLRENKHKLFTKTITGIVLVAFCLTSVPSYALAQTFAQMPAPGQMVALTSAFAPALIKGLCVDPQNPFKFDFIVDVGDSGLEGEAFNEETTRLIKYFLASLTIPEKDLWVNLSPFEKDRIVPEGFGATDMGRDLLAQDYLLKQLTASLISPETAVGKAFWEKVYKQAYEKFGTTQVPTDTFNKVWIIPEKARVYENGDKAFVVESRLKVMLESDYLAVPVNSKKDLVSSKQSQIQDTLTSQIVRDIVLPELEKEVNEGKSFATLRQVYHSFILATWFKQTLKESILNKKYSDQKKTDGLTIANTNETNEIYAKYLEAYKKGVCNMIKVERDSYTNKNIPRKYFSGGMNLNFSSSALVITRIFSDVKEYIKTHGEKRLRKVLITLEDLAWRAQDAVRPVKNPDPQISRDRSLLTPNEVHKAIEEGLPKEFKDFSSLSPSEQEEIKDNYRDRQGRIVIRVEGLYKKTKLLGHIGLGQYYGEPVIYLDPELNLDQLRAVKAHEEYMIEKWESFRKGLRKGQGYTYQQMREWINENSNRQGTGEAQKMARQWNREAPSIEHVYQEIFFANLTDTDREKQFKFQQARVKRMTRDIIRAFKNYVKDHQSLQIPLGKTTYDGFWNEKAINFIIANVEKKSTFMASARYKTGTIGALLDFALFLTDSQLAHVIGHELTHQFIKKGVLTLGVNGNFDSQNLFNTYLAEENPRLFQETELSRSILDSIAKALKKAVVPFPSSDANNLPDGHGSQEETLETVNKAPDFFQAAAMQTEALKDTMTSVMSLERNNALRGYRSQMEEKFADYVGVLLMTVGGFSPFEAEGMMRGLPTFKSPNLLRDTDSETVNYKTHPDLIERLEIVRAAVERYENLAVGDIYDTDVVSAVEPADLGPDTGSSASPLDRSLGTAAAPFLKNADDGAASPIGSTLDISDENEYMNYRDYKNYDAFLTRYGVKIQNTKTKEPLAETVQRLVDEKFGTNGPVRILDAGCGLGMSLVNLKFQYGRNVDLYGIDKKQSRIEDMGPKARQGLLEEYGPDVQEMYETMAPKISFFKGEEYDIATTKVEDENGAQVPMDFITALFVLQYLSDPLAGWSNLFHQLADGGTFVSQFLFVNDEEGLRNEAFYVSFFNEMRNRGVDIEMNVAELETDGKKTGERVLFVSAVRKGNQKITLNIKPVAVREITLPIEKENRSYTFNQVSYAQTAGGERIVISSGIETRTVDVLLEDYINSLTENLKERKGKLADLIKVRSPNIVVEGQRSLIKKREERLLAAEKYVREIKKYLKDGTVGEFIKALKEIEGGALADELLSEDQKEALILAQKELKDFGFDPGMFLFIPIDSWVHGILHGGPIFESVKGYHIVVLDHGQPVALNVIISDKSERRRLIRIVIHEFFHGEFDEGDVFLARRFSGQPDPAIVFLHHILNEAMTEDLTVETIGRLYGNLAADLGSTYINEREFLNGILSLPLKDNSAKEAVIKLLREGDPAFLQEIFGKDWDAFLSLLEIALSEGQLSHEAQLIFYMLSFLLKEGNGKDTVRLTNGLEFIKLVQEIYKNIFETQDIFAGIKKYYGTARRLFEDLTIEQAFDTPGAIADRKDEIREKLLVASSGIGKDETVSSSVGNDDRQTWEDVQKYRADLEQKGIKVDPFIKAIWRYVDHVYPNKQKTKNRFYKTDFLAAYVGFNIEKKWNLPVGLTELDIQRLCDLEYSRIFFSRNTTYRNILKELWRQLKALNPELESELRSDRHPEIFTNVDNDINNGRGALSAETFLVLDGFASRYNSADIVFFVGYRFYKDSLSTAYEERLKEIEARIKKDFEYSPSSETLDKIASFLSNASDGKGEDRVVVNGGENIFDSAKQAEFYDSFNGQPFIQVGDDRIALSMTTEDPALRAEVATKIKKIVPRNKAVLEVGAGQGHHVEALINEGLLDITAVDISKKNVLAAQARVAVAIKGKAKKPKVNIQQGDAYDLAFEKNHFDVVIFNESVGGLQDMEKAFAEAARVLRRGGLMIVTTYNKDKESVVQDARETHYLSHSVEAIKEALVKSGFENVADEDILSAKAQGALSFFTATKVVSSSVGGIDLNAENFELERDKGGQGVTFDAKNFENVEINGLTPVILSVTPVINLQMLLGAASIDQNKRS